MQFLSSCPCGGDVNKSKRGLTREQVVAIRADKDPYRVIAKKYGTSKSNVYEIKHYITYKDY
jgi:DNA invertase Pin-like site-specific DNA recombinase